MTCVLVALGGVVLGVLAAAAVYVYCVWEGMIDHGGT